MIQAKSKFRFKVKSRLAKHGNKVRLTKETGLNRKSLWLFLKGNPVKRKTLEILVKKFEGENANVEDYIKPL